MDIYVSSINFVTEEQRRITDIIPIMLDAGIRNIEISSIHPYEPDLEQKMIDWSTDARFLIHNFAPPSQQNLILNLSSRNPNIRKATSEFIKERILFCNELGIDYYSFHAGFCVEYEFGKKEYTDIMQRRDALDLFIAELQDLVDFSKSEGIHIGIENHVSMLETQRLLFLDDIKDFEYLFNELVSDYLHIHLDFGHLNVSSRTRGFSKKEFIQKFSDRIMAVHAHDNDELYDEHKPLTHHSWYLEELSSFDNLKYFILETETKGDSESINQMIDIVQSMK